MLVPTHLIRCASNHPPPDEPVHASLLGSILMDNDPQVENIAIDELGPDGVYAFAQWFAESSINTNVTCLRDYLDSPDHVIVDYRPLDFATRTAEYMKERMFVGVRG